MKTKPAQLKFIIDKNYDYEMIFNMLSEGEPAGIENRAKGMKIDLALARKIQRFGKKQGKKIVRQLVEKRYGQILPYLKKVGIWYQQSWDEINEAFFRHLEKKTGYKIKYKKYFCVVSAFHPGISSWGGNKIARIWAENPFTMRKITAHELIISHIFHIFQDDHQFKNKLKDQEIWKIAEIAAWCLTGKEKEMIKMWPWVPKDQLFPLKHNYPFLVPLQIKLGKVYDSAGSFKKFLNTAVNLVNKF
ncbi:MAG: hypothetical protein A2Y67_02865 [Candidatus Buchananbacteria bacterium RBG_13_39_9]|uniref:Uncharacterized protein n=1 Tax=Candidatus Buchananbacteria bacterium RBG_13_39_9 TaxID=1797531 RepID=A0A1G1XUK4_9BACT|nr:MAG: hypothetical protein A2Y67_02865 [Candidatus Buchananbacteria bacterium RBG_13_39_9]